jgi:GT2 family glycosyltransferase
MIQPKVLILILIYNGLSNTIECLESLNMLSFQNYHILIVDNDSRDGSVQYLREHYPETIVIENHTNLGYAAGNNVGINYFLDHDYTHLLIINNDITVEPMLIDTLLVDLANDSTAGVIGPVNYSYYNHQTVLFNYAHLDLRKYRYQFFNTVATSDFGIIATDYVNGACMLLKREVLEQIEAFDAEFFLYWEETDLCFRAKQAGYRCYTSQNTFIYHKEGASIKQRYSEIRMYYMTRNRLRFFKKNGLFSNRIYYYLWFDFFIWVLSCLKHQPVRVPIITKAFLKALFDFWKGRMGKLQAETH